MILVLMAAFVGLMIFAIHMDEKHGECSESWCVIAGVNLVGAAVCFIAAFILLLSVGGKDRVLDEQISMYEEENIKIEAIIDSVVKDYLGYEKDTYKTIRDDGGTIASVIAYPELASSELVTKQLEVYVANNEKIKELKKDKIELSREKWWLYFGK